MRTLARQLRSHLHSPGVDQSRLEHCVPMRFYYVMNSSNQHHHSNVLRSRILTWSRSSRRQHACQMRFLRWHCVPEQVLGFVHAATQKCPRVHVLRDSQIVPSLVGSETLESICSLMSKRCRPSPALLKQGGGCNPALQKDRIVEGAPCRRFIKKSNVGA